MTFSVCCLSLIITIIIIIARKGEVKREAITKKIPQSLLCVSVNNAKPYILLHIMNIAHENN